MSNSLTANSPHDLGSAFLPNGDIDLNLFFNSAKDLFCVAGFDGFFKKVNPAVTETLGYTEAELLSRPINSFVFPDDQLATEHRRQALREEQVLKNFENRYVTKNGELVWLSWTSVPNAELRLVFAVAKNITPQKIEESKRDQAFENLSAYQQELKDVVYTALHDLRAPVGNMMSIFDIYNELKTPISPYEESLSLLKATIRELKVKMDNYLDRLVNKGKQESIHGEVKLSSVVNRIKTSLAALINESKAVITTDFSQAAAICFDEDHLDSIFLNLISNSIKYARPGVPPVIELTSKPDGACIQVKVKDNGLGFNTKKVKGRIFEEQQRFHPGVEGKGLGLYLVKMHLTSGGADISVHSKPNQGTTFTISFKK
ncbi:PAS domain-containing sensor histidine kinase [Mucilaginibacter terrenus]|uniref:histidine kinase n=1 Tax=Mucilaginibacter terrenus TaxID=2482727 RepID=A0A3E2NR40_9SPHI|nr:PAS domain-containing sensor histidine kinase [Mucilaginibacter terrenus]RFZ83457.1 PAS domain-containing sensor histidine kinase [Mucilaginibacter terrenus]